MRADRIPAIGRRRHDESRAPDRGREGDRAGARGRVRASASPDDIPVGGDSVLAALKLGVHLAWRAGRISDHDALIGRALAWILAGGDVRTPAR